MSPSQDPLQEYDLKNLPELQKRLMGDWPRSIVFVKWLETRIPWYQREPAKYPIYIHSPGGNIDEGLVAYGDLGDRSLYLTFYNFKHDVSSLKSALLQTRKIDWSRKMLCAIPNELTEWMSEIIQTLGYEIEEIDKTGSYLLPAHKAKTSIGLPSDVHLARLDEDDVPMINSLWPFGFEWSEEYLVEMIRMNYGFGLYKDDGDLVAWAMKYEYGDIGVLHTVDEHRKRGLAMVLTKFLATIMNCNREEVYLLIIDGNVASEGMARQLGFERVGSYNWIHYKERS